MAVAGERIRRREGEKRRDKRKPEAKEEDRGRKSEVVELCVAEVGGNTLSCTAPVGRADWHESAC